MVSKFNCAAVVVLFGARGRLKRSRSEHRCVVGSTINPQLFATEKPEASWELPVSCGGPGQKQKAQCNVIH